MTAQQPLFPSAACPLHSAEYVCDQEGLDTGGDGFVHKSLRKGRTALRTCKGCKQLKSKADWSGHDWSRCMECER